MEHRTSPTDLIEPIKAGLAENNTTAVGNMDSPTNTELLCSHCDIKKSRVIEHYPLISDNREHQPGLNIHDMTDDVQHHRYPRCNTRYREAQRLVYNFLERPCGYIAISYHIFVFVLVSAYFCLTVLSTLPDFEDTTQRPLACMEIGLVIWLSAELVLRTWSLGSTYDSAKGKLQLLKRPLLVIDTLVVLASIVVAVVALIIGIPVMFFFALALRGLRLCEVLRMDGSRQGTCSLFISVIWAHWQGLLTTGYVGFLGIVFFSYMIYLVEKDFNERFTTFADSLWWGMITLTTVGYGDSIPISWKGKLIAGVGALMGISFLALPASILGTGFALKVQQQQQQKTQQAYDDLDKDNRITADTKLSEPTDQRQSESAFQPTRKNNLIVAKGGSQGDLNSSEMIITKQLNDVEERVGEILDILIKLKKQQPSYGTVNIGC